MKKIPYKILLPEYELPSAWLNLLAVMKNKPSPAINPSTMKPATESDFHGLFSHELTRQEFDEKNEYIEIPEPIREFMRMYRPSPLCRAYNLEKALNTPARIYYKYEGNNSSGSHKLNSALPQAYFNKNEGITSLTTETGAGQWGTALAIACGFFDMPLTIYMVKGSTIQKPYRKAVMETFGAKVIASPSVTTKVGRDILKKFPDTSGSLGCAISEAVETAVSTNNCRYVLGSVLNQVILHQTIIGLETIKQMQSVDEYPDIIIGCAGGGSNIGGLIAPFIKNKIDGTANPYIIAVEPVSCPSLTRGRFAYDYCDTGHLTPLAKMYTLGSEFMPSSIHAGGLRYHGMSPIVSQLYHDRLIDEARAEKQTEVFEAAQFFSKHEALLPAPESAHAVKAAIDEALKCKKTGEAKTILFGFTGHGNFDLTAYSSYLSGSMEDYIPTDDEIEQSLKTLPEV